MSEVESEEVETEAVMCEYCDEEEAVNNVMWDYRLGAETYTARMQLCEECTKLFVHWESSLTFRVKDL